jgi:sulfur-oxidizing protein SoxZ
MSEVKLRAALKDGKCEVKALMTHPMETGRRKDPEGNLIPAHYIETVELLHNGNLMMEADWGGAISTNPFFSISLKNVAAGDTIEVRWVDNKGEKSSGTVQVK